MFPGTVCGEGCATVLVGIVREKGYPFAQQVETKELAMLMRLLLCTDGFMKLDLMELSVYVAMENRRYKQ